MPAWSERKVDDLEGAPGGRRVERPANGAVGFWRSARPRPSVGRRRRACSLLLGRALGLGLRGAEEAREEGLHAVPEGHRAITHIVPGVLRLGLGGLAGFLDLVARGLGAADHRLAHALCGVLYAMPDLLAAALDLLGAFLDLGVVGCRGRSHSEQPSTNSMAVAVAMVFIT